MFVILNATTSMCEQIPAELTHITSSVVTLIQIAIPIMLIIWGMLDFGKAVSAGDDKKIKEAQGLFTKRLIAAIVVFLMVVIVRTVLGIFVTGDEGTANSAIDCAVKLIGG